MRIVGGKFRGRRLPAPKGATVRPTSDRVREAIASALEARTLVRGAHVLDLFAGTGALGFEMLSRGASSVRFVDHDAKVLSSIRSSAVQLGCESQCTFVKADLLSNASLTESGLSRIVGGSSDPANVNLLFADPPYASIQQIPALFQALASRLEVDTTLVLEHAKGDGEFEQQLDAFVRMNQKSYGNTSVSFFRRV